MKYARARTYFEAQHWEEAALAFRDVAINHADKDAGDLRGAALPRVGQRARRSRGAAAPRVLRRHGASDVPMFLELYCKGQQGRGQQGDSARS